MSGVEDLATLTPSDAADVWLVRREGGVDIEADPAFTHWLSADPENLKAWALTSAFWERAGEESGSPVLEAIRRDALAARPPSRPPWAVAGAGVAAALAASVAGWMVLAPHSQTPPQAPWIATTATATFSNGRALPRTIGLADGSKVTLDADSAVAVAYAGPRRGVRLLQGRAYFDVVHDPAKPFRVEVGERWVSDLGTEFDVRSIPQGLRVTVASGEVAVGSPAAPQGTVVSGGQAVTVGPDGAGRVSKADLGADLAWRQGLLKFEKTPLADAAREINRYGGGAITVVGAGDLRVSGQFRPGDPRRFAKTLAEIYPVQVRDRADGGVEIVGKSAR